MAEPKGPLAARLRALVRWLEALGAAAALGMFRLLPLDLASATGGWLCRRLGPLAPVSRRAERNLRRAFPEKTDAEIRRLLVAMWENLGRVFGEYPHLARFRLYKPQGRVEVVGVEHADRLREDGKTGIFFSAHIGNWELLAVGATQLGLPLARIYRVPNNPLVDQLMRAARRSVEGELLPKGAEGARRALAVMRAGGHLAMLVDQKMNDGIAVPFFGRPAMTAPALAQLALKFDCPVVPAKVERLAGCRFRLTIYQPLTIERSGERKRDVLALMTRVNAIIEGWIRERPEQWLWLHRRWPN
jgi:Kdo2-lipid IVA lauroyltransferase/acyltransferase